MFCVEQAVTFRTNPEHINILRGSFMNKKMKPAAIGAAVLSAIIAPVAFFLIRRHKTPKVPTCGGCLKNCYLDAPGCRIGREKAEKWKNGEPWQET